jgi:hypothetical protein
MMMQDHKPEDQTAIRTTLGAIFVSLELSRSTWLVTSLSRRVAGRRCQNILFLAATFRGC